MHHTTLIFYTLLIVSVVKSAEPEFQKLVQDCRKHTCIGTKTMIKGSASLKCQKEECSAVAIIKHLKDNYEVKLVFDPNAKIGTGGVLMGYLGFGIGKTEMMDRLFCLECVFNRKTGKVFAHVSWSKGPAPGMPARANKDKTKQFKPSVSSTGPYKVCTFNIPNQFIIEKEEFDLKNKQYKLSIAGGSGTGSDIPHLTYHVGVVSINAIKNPGVNKRHVHGVLMTIAYMCLMPIGLIIPRFYRETWINARFLVQKRIWFPIHAILMYSALILGVISYIVIISELQTVFKSYSTAHAVLGSLSLILLILQTVVPWCIEFVSYEIIKIYYIVHTVIGWICYSLGIINIAYASIWLNVYQPCAGIFIACLWIACHLSAHIILTTLMLLNDEQLDSVESKFRALTAFPMKIKWVDEAPGAQLRIIILGAVIAVSISTSIAMCYVIVYGETPCTSAPLV